MSQTTVIAPLPESRPTPWRWPAVPLVSGHPGQPALDLRPAVDRLLTVPDDLADRTAPGVPDARAWSVALATTLLEVLSARRPSGQLSRWLAEEVLTPLLPALPSGRRAAGSRQRFVPPPVRLVSVRLQYPRTGAVEVSVHGRLGSRSLAMAMRLEARQDRWLCTALELGPGCADRGSDPT